MWKKLAATTALGLVLSGQAMADYAAGQREYANANYTNAFMEFQDSANNGDASSQYMLGQLYAEGRGVRQDFVKAHMWYSLAASWGLDRADEARRNVERYMTSAQISQARQLAQAWHAPVASAPAQSNIAYSVLNAQIILNRLGYNAGPADGAMGPKTRDAIRTYQADQRISVTGELTRSLFDRMAADVSGGTQNVASSTDTTASATLISNIQSELRRRGYDIPLVSGQLDVKTAAAIRAYQSQSGMQVSGLASDALLTRLRASQGTTDVQSQRSLVSSVQSALNQRGYNAGPADGVFGPTTRSAVRAYQADNGLPATGEVTQSLLVQLQSNANGDEGERQRREMTLAVEQELSARGYAVGPVDGVVDAATLSAVRTYQSDAGIAINGRVDEQLLADLRGAPQDAMTERELVRNIQIELNRLGYNVGPEDGGFGPKTRSAIMAYQTETNIEVTGEASDRLLSRLKRTERTVVNTDPGLSQQEMVQQIEVELNRLGWDVGTPNSEWGSKSRTAAREFQSKIGVTADGIADAELLNQLQNSYRQGSNEAIINGLAQQFLDAIQNN